MPHTDVPPDPLNRAEGALGPVMVQPPAVPSRARRVLLWVVIPLAGVCVLAVVAFVGLSLWGLWVYANHDRTEWIDDPVVQEEAERACVRMHTDLDDVLVADGATVAQQAAAMKTQDEVVLQMVEDVRDLGERRLSRDMPSQAWLEDWEDLVKARETYAADLVAGGSPELLVPTVDDVPITERMQDVMLDCDVPPELLNVPAPPD